MSKFIKGPVAECAFVAKSLLRERGEAEILRHMRSIWREISAKPQPRRNDCSRNGIRQQAHQGFTLVELIVSIALLALLVFGVASLFPRAVGLVQRAETLTAAASLAQAQLENLLAQDYQTLTVGTYETRHFVSGALERQTLVAYLDPATLAESPIDQGLKRAQVNVYAPSAFGQKTFSISTFIVKK